MTDSLPSRTTPDGSRESLYVAPSMTRVWPALWPPWKRTTMSACSDSQSTILPLPSSPHCDPTTTTFAIQEVLSRDLSRQIAAFFGKPCELCPFRDSQAPDNGTAGPTQGTDGIGQLPLLNTAKASRGTDFSL